MGSPQPGLDPTRALATSLAWITRDRVSSISLVVVASIGEEPIDGGCGPFLGSERVTEFSAVMLATPAEVAAEATASVTGDGEGALRSCAVPVLAVHAVTGSVTDASRLVVDCKNLVVGQTVGAGHFMQLEAPALVRAMIERCPLDVWADPLACSLPRARLTL